MAQPDTEQTARHALTLSRANQACWWVTVLSTFGASSAQPGSVMAVGEQGASLGSLGPDSVNREIVGRIRETVPGDSVDWTFGDTTDSARALGLPVGADPVVVRVERLRDRKIAGLRELVELLAQRQSAARSSSTGEVCWAPPLAPVVGSDGATLVHHPAWRVIVTSATPLTVELCERLSGLAFECDVIEPREAFQSGWPERTELSHCRLHLGRCDDLVCSLGLDQRTGVLALAHAPVLDDPLLLASLDTPAFLIGALGSRANHAARLDRLRATGASEEALARINGPVGLQIGSRTPAEISVAIIAQLISARRSVSA